MTRKTTQSRLDSLVAAFTELGPAWGRWVQTCMPDTSVSYIRMRLLRSLECEGDQTMSQLATNLVVTQRRVTALVDALEADGFVERRPHPSDGRSTIVSLTDAGRAQQDVNWQQQQTEIGVAFGDLPVDMQKQLLEITPLLTQALRRRASERGGD